MKLEFRDFYQQHVEITDQTSSGNIRIDLHTCADLNQVAIMGKDECDTKVCISLNEAQARIVLAALQAMVEGEE